MKAEKRHCMEDRQFFVANQSSLGDFNINQIAILQWLAESSGRELPFYYSL
jgi:hypothetical protein